MSEFPDAIQDKTIEEATTEPPETFMQVVEVDLTPNEQDALKDKLVDCDKRMIAVEGEKAVAMSGFNQTLKNLRKERISLLDSIASGVGRREIACYEEREDATGRMLIKRVDNNEIVDERALTLEERDHIGLVENDDDDDDFNDPAPDTEPPSTTDDDSAGRTVHSS